MSGGTYGPLKVLAEQAAEAAMPGRVLTVRPCVVVGPYDPTDRFKAMSYMQEHQQRGEIVTGWLYVDPMATDLHLALNTTHRPLNTLGPAELSPGAKALDKINAELR